MNDDMQASPAQPATAPATDPVKQSAEALLTDLGLNDVSEEKKQALIGQIVALMDKEILFAVMTRLTDEDIEELERYMQETQGDRPLNEQTYEFLANKIPDLQKTIEDAMVAVYDRLKDTNTLVSN